ncbi:MAG: substrate-binding domain-containing protein [Lachnospiraceae bacterium]|nr:substrate-binding domain-containing protein [Lachnospiraceae bacterium]
MASDNASGPHSLGIIYAEESGQGLAHPFFVQILDSFKQEAERLGYDVTFINHNAEGNKLSYLERSRLCKVDGVCMVCVDFSSPEIKELALSDMPCVTVDHIFKKVPAVLSDNERGVQSLVEYAVKRGHRRIAFVHGHNNSVVTRSRIQQFYNTMDYYGYPVPPEYVKSGLYEDIPLTRKLVLELLELPERPTCILLPDDITYLGAQDAAKEMGLRIPEDISFTGYDGIPLSQVLSPRLTTVHQSMEEIGSVSAKRLVDLIEHPDTVNRFPSVFPVTLVEGETVAEL